MDRREREPPLLVAVRAALRGWQAGLWTALPGIVEAYDATKLTVSVQPAIQAQTQDQTGTWSNVNLPLLVDCPVVFPAGGGFVLTFPIAKGDEGLIVFASRCIDSWYQSGGVQPQAEQRLHDLSDGFFIPGGFSQPKVPTAISTTAVELRNTDGSFKFSIGPQGCRVTGPIVFEGPVTFLSDVNGEPGAGPVVFGQPVHSTGDIVAGHGGGDQVGLQTHKHPTAALGGPSSPTPGT